MALLPQPIIWFVEIYAGKWKCPRTGTGIKKPFYFYSFTDWRRDFTPLQLDIPYDLSISVHIHSLIFNGKKNKEIGNILFTHYHNIRAIACHLCLAKLQCNAESIFGLMFVEVCKCRKLMLKIIYKFIRFYMQFIPESKSIAWNPTLLP
jgi:hypothetical protein